MRKELVDRPLGIERAGSVRVMTPSLIISDQTRRSAGPTSSWPPRSGSARCPIAAWCRLSANAATRSPMALAPPRPCPTADDRARRPRATRRSSSSGISPSPNVYGMRAFICAITRPPRARACSMAAGRMLTSIPSETLPWRGNEVWISTTSTGRIALEQSGHQREPHRQVVEHWSWRMPGPDKGRLGR